METLSKVLNSRFRIEFIPEPEAYRIKLTNPQNDTYIHCSMSHESIKYDLKDSILLETLENMFTKLNSGV